VIKAKLYKIKRIILAKKKLISIIGE
jgi:hypothetical protein